MLQFLQQNFSETKIIICGGTATEEQARETLPPPPPHPGLFDSTDLVKRRSRHVFLRGFYRLLVSDLYVIHLQCLCIQ